MNPRHLALWLASIGVYIALTLAFLVAFARTFGALASVLLALVFTVAVLPKGHQRISKRRTR